MNNETILNIENLKFVWPGQNQPTLDIKKFSINKGEHVFLKGPSGSGKSTLLGLITGINQAQSGKIQVLDKTLSRLNSRQKDHFRANHLGYIFQQFNLLPYLNLMDNVTLPCLFSKSRKNSALALSGTLQKEAQRLLSHLEIPQKLFYKKVTELSIGQQQRVAAARALIGRPEFIIADEPTSSLDAETRASFIKLLFHECEEAKSSLLFVSHDQGLETLFNNKVNLTNINNVEGDLHGHH
ncbi:MAG: ABC transporter ATP-binding protein [Alteromonadales bacterium]|nr:ABC transporter ATP-binding protein [Alteromonadales bacterium]